MLVVRETDENRDKAPPSDDAGLGLALKDVEFRYLQCEARVLKSVSISIRPGQFIAFVGASGCGKSTIISLLERYHDPTSGQIVITDDHADGNETDIRTLSPRLYRGP